MMITVAVVVVAVRMKFHVFGNAARSLAPSDDGGWPDTKFLARL